MTDNQPTDILIELRELENDPFEHSGQAAFYGRAADEIERLRAALRQIADGAEPSTDRDLRDKVIAGLIDTLTRLRVYRDEDAARIHLDAVKELFIQECVKKTVR